jgi:predicted N-acetyltransferase YhbS
LTRPRIRFLEEGDEAALLQHLQEAFGTWPRVEIDVPPLEHLRWKLRGPDGAARHVVAEAGSKIVGSVLIWPQTLKLGEQTARGYQGVDVAVRPEYRNQGLMGEMLRFTIENIGKQFDVEFGVLSGHATMQRATTARGGRRASAAIDVLAAEPRYVRKASPSNVELTCATAFDERVDGLVAEASRTFDVFLERSVAWLNWRFADRRAGAFVIHSAEDRGTPAGYAVLGFSGRYAVVAGLITHPDRPDVLDAVLSSALCAAAERQVERVECWMPQGHPQRPAAERAGFVSKRRTLHLTFGGLRLPDEALAAVERPETVVHVAAGDTDLV